MARLFIVEDEFIIAQHLTAIAEGLGHEVVGVADNVAEALRQLAALPALPALLLLDIMLEGELDGVDLANRARAAYGLPVLFITSLTTPATVARAKAVQPVGYLVKPFDEHEVFVALELALATPPAAGAAPPAGAPPPRFSFATASACCA